MREKIDIEPDAIQTYLDECIEFWRESDEEFSLYYVDAFQSVRVSLFGEIKP